MSEEVSASAPVVAEVSSSAPETTEDKTSNGHKDEPAQAEGNGDAEETEAVAPRSADAAATTSDDVPASDATPASKDKKRKSIGGVPEHKAKKLNKKKSMATLHLDCKPGQFFWARLKGYPPWPSVICDESMLPESLLATRPVSTARPDGTIRPDYEEGGKNAKERTFPIMFLSTNEFQWMINTNLTPLDPEDCKTTTSKMSKALLNAYEVASENHDLQYFKDILMQWQEENEAIAKANAEAEAEAEAAAKAAAEESSKEKPKKKPARKSKAADEEEDATEAKAPKSSKKRKNDAGSEADTPKPKKTPKVTKINAPKTPSGEESTKKPKSTKKKVVSAPKAEEEEEPQSEMTEAERLQVRQKTILYLRHRLQKGFLTRDKAPEESEMAEMNKHLSTLEGHQDLEVNIIKETKIHKVLKGIVKLASVPRDDEFNFKKRSSALLEIWNQRIDAAGDGAAKNVDAADEEKAVETNGAASHEEHKVNGKTDEAKKESEGETKDGDVVMAEPSNDENKPAAEVEGDVAMEE